MSNYSDYCTKLFGEHSCTEEDCPTCPSAKIISEHDSELLDKVAERINSLHYDTCDGVTRRIEHCLKAEVFKVIAELKAEVEK